ncbi:gigasin-6-like [Mytilus edulis]|uniref:gigasin-6-like n=1 Tax=Mytilus edulis TaxID=6550 RepID=UPI0039F03A39
MLQVKMFRFFLLYSVVACLNGQLNVQIDKILKETFDCKFKSNKTVGLTLSVVRSDKVLFVGGYGFVNIKKETPVTGDTLFQVASLSKAFASVLLTKLIEEKTNYTLDTKLKEIIPGKKIFYDSLRSDYVTLRDLLSHKLGIPKHDELRYDTELTRKNLVARLKYLKPEGIFRGSYMYNNLMYGVVTYLAELIGNDSWENLVTKHIFEPQHLLQQQTQKIFCWQKDTWNITVNSIRSNITLQGNMLKYVEQGAYFLLPMTCLSGHVSF